jgi:hypothetical protein
VSFVRGLGRFAWDFVIGDDWKIAATVACVLTGGAVLVAAAGRGASWLAPACGGAVLLAFLISFVADVRRA